MFSPPIRGAKRKGIGSSVAQDKEPEPRISNFCIVTLNQEHVL
jgi:hypothetical protein